MRHRSEVEKLTFDSLTEAIAEGRRRAEEVRREGGLETVSAFRDYTPDRRVHARIEVSGKGLLRGPEAGVDVMGDGSLVPYKGAVRKQPLEADALADAFDRIEESLEE